MISALEVARVYEARKLILECDSQLALQLLSKGCYNRHPYWTINYYYYNYNQHMAEFFFFGQTHGRVGVIEIGRTKLDMCTERPARFV